LILTHATPGAAELGTALGEWHTPADGQVRKPQCFHQERSRSKSHRVVGCAISRRRLGPRRRIDLGSGWP